MQLVMQDVMKCTSHTRHDLNVFFCLNTIFMMQHKKHRERSFIFQSLASPALNRSNLSLVCRWVSSYNSRILSDSKSFFINPLTFRALIYRSPANDDFACSLHEGFSLNRPTNHDF